jgi:hypothetical protein
LAGGLLNVLLLAPTWMQIVHLLGADLVWIAYVILAARVLDERDTSPAGHGLPAVGVARH